MHHTSRRCVELPSCSYSGGYKGTESSRTESERETVALIRMTLTGRNEVRVDHY